MSNELRRAAQAVVDDIDPRELSDHQWVLIDELRMALAAQPQPDDEDYRRADIESAIHGVLRDVSTTFATDLTNAIMPFVTGGGVDEPTEAAAGSATPTMENPPGRTTDE